MMTKKRIYTISEDLANKGLDHIFKYVWQRKHNHLNLKMLSYAFIEAVKRRMTKKI